MSARDHDRTLAPRGREAAPRVGAYMAGHGLIPDRVICSTAVRTRQTWDLVGAAFERDIPVTYERRIYEADADAILGVIRETSSGAHSLLLIGHNPGMKNFAELMIATGGIEPRQQLLEKFPTGALAVIDFPIDAWSRLHPHAGRLDRLITPRTLDTATD